MSATADRIRFQAADDDAVCEAVLELVQRIRLRLLFPPVPTPPDPEPLAVPQRRCSHRIAARERMKENT